MFNDAEWSALVAKLQQLTEAGLVAWELYGTDLSLKIGNATYLITPEDDDGVAPWVLHVRKSASDNEWVEIDTLTSSPGWNKVDPRAQLVELRDFAYRMAMGGPQLALNLLEDLNLIDPTPPPTVKDTPF